MLVWRFDAPVRCVATTVLGGGLGDRAWVANATVALDYREADPAADAARIAAACGLGADAGAALLTGVDVRRFEARTDGAAEVVATVGLDVVTWAAAAPGQHERWRPASASIPTTCSTCRRR